MMLYYSHNGEKKKYKFNPHKIHGLKTKCRLFLQKNNPKQLNI